jgi:phosphocarrier protein HPr
VTDTPAAPAHQLSQVVKITNKRGLHARASAKFVTLAAGQPCAIEVEKEGSKVAGTSIMGLMMLGAAMGDHVTISTAGDGAEEALTLLVELVENKFGEE